MDEREYRSRMVDDAFWRAVDLLNQLQAVVEDKPVTEEMSAKSKRIVEKLLKECKE